MWWVTECLTGARRFQETLVKEGNLARIREIDSSKEGALIDGLAVALWTTPFTESDVDLSVIHLAAI